jgi:hemolysin activation/secretion protein
MARMPDFKGRVIYPYFFGTPVGADYALKIYRRDSTFIDINNDFGLQYYFSGLNNFKIFYKKRSSNLISANGLAAVSVLPEYADISTGSYGAGLQLEKLNYRFNPRNGFAFFINAQTGNKTIKKNPKINEIVYDGITLKSVQYQFESVFALYVPLYKNSVLKFNLQGASVFGNATIFRNELFRIGGLKTLRGFDEESIYARRYGVLTSEYRLISGKNSFFFGFMDAGLVQYQDLETQFNNSYIGAGLGMVLETKNSLINISWGIGKRNDQSIDFRQSKIHVGLINFF